MTDESKSGVYQGVLGMVLLVPFWEIFNGQIGHKSGNQNKGVAMKILGILHDFRIFFIGNGSFKQILRKARKISNNIWPGKLMTNFFIKKNIINISPAFQQNNLSNTSII